MGSILWLRDDMYPFEHVVQYITIDGDTPHYPVQDSRLTHTIDTTKHIHLRVKIPYNMFPTSPKGVYLYPLDIIRILLHIDDLIK
jgi:hypothetical protein